MQGTGYGFFCPAGRELLLSWKGIATRVLCAKVRDRNSLQLYISTLYSHACCLLFSRLGVIMIHSLVWLSSNVSALLYFLFILITRMSGQLIHTAANFLIHWAKTSSAHCCIFHGLVVAGLLISARRQLIHSSNVMRMV